MRDIINFDKGWLFHRGDIERFLPNCKAAVYNGAKTVRMISGPAAREYETYSLSTEVWRKVDLPHDFIIEGEVDKDNNEGLGFFPYPNGWYRKKFYLDEADSKRRLTLFFEGIATHATVYVNGCLMKHNFCGYTSFEVDFTDIATFGGENTVSVYVETGNHEGWWYEGGGIYRHVRLIKADLLSIDLWGVYAKPVYDGEGKWRVLTETTVRNDYFTRKSVTIIGEIIDADDKVVSTARASGRIGEKDKRCFTYCFDISSPDLWSPDFPIQYTMRTRVYNGDRETDSYDVRFGFRTLRIDPEKGLYINEKHYKIKGLCGHADFGLSGKAVPDNIHRYKVTLMKEMGANGYRTTHYPQAEALMDALDENGFIVMNETRWFESTEEGKAQLEMLMKRDRNRPGVVFWSLGNEEPLHTTEAGRRIAQSLIAHARRLDDTRFITTAVYHAPDKATVYDEFSVIGVNYNWKAYNEVHERFEDKAVLSSENCATGSTRGWYFDASTENAFLPAYDRDTGAQYRSREYTWKFIDSRDWLIGGYQWIAFEHRGEAVWPRLCSQSGAIDLFMQKKDAFYQNRSHWTVEPMVHLLPHWNFRGLEGEDIKVFAYTNLPRLELFLNGQSLGVRDIEKHGHGEWIVPYETGKIEVRGYDKDGHILATDTKVTSSTPKQLMLVLENEDVSANGEDLAIISCYTVDAEGNEVYDATPLVEFFTNSLGKIYSTGSDITDHASIFSSKRKMRAGRITVAVKIGVQAGTLKVYAKSEGLESAVLDIEVK